MIAPTSFLLLAILQPKIVCIDAVLGTGLPASKGDLLTVSYRGSLQNGVVFDETRDKSPFVLRLGEGKVIAGWEEALLGMKKGGRRFVSIPPELGYGQKAVGTIPPNSTLIFDIEVLRVDKPNGKVEIEVVEDSLGTGEAVKLGDKVEVHYTGKFLNGTKFDSSVDRGKTFNVEVGKTGIIKGFEQGLIGMKLGGKRTVTIPYQLAYGEQGRPPVIPPQSTLVFELEIIKIDPAQ